MADFTEDQLFVSFIIASFSQSDMYDKLSGKLHAVERQLDNDIWKLHARPHFLTLQTRLPN